MSEDGQDSTEGDPVQHACRLGDVDSGRAPTLAGLGKRG
jgi:hypothetical protein